MARPFASVGALHDAIQRLGSIGWFRVVLARGLGHLDDVHLAEPELIPPALDVQTGWPALPPPGQGGRIEAQRREQVPEKPIRDALARLRALLLLYWFS